MQAKNVKFEILIMPNFNVLQKEKKKEIMRVNCYGEKKKNKKKTCTSSASIGLHYGIKKCLFTLESKCVVPLWVGTGKKEDLELKSYKRNILKLCR